jgi:hypothetical protein
VVRLADAPRQSFVDDPGSEDQQVVLRGSAVGDVLDEAPEMLQAVRLSCRLRPSTAVTNGGIVPDVPRGTVVCRDVRHDPLDA